MIEVIVKSNQWAIQDAKARLSEVVKKAQAEGAQYISVRNEPAVVIISQKEYQDLKTPKTSMVDFFRQSPLVGLELDLSRNKSKIRSVKL